MNTCTISYTLVLVFMLSSNGLKAFLVDNDNDVCSIMQFANCSKDFMRVLDITNSSTNLNQESIYKFYCGTNFTRMLDCMKNKLNPSCGPGTDNYQIRQSLENVDPNMYEKLCRNDSSHLDFLSCQTKLPQVDGFINCVTGDTLNKTVDPTDQCSFLKLSMGCSFKYTSLMCPNSLSTFQQYATQNPGGCDFQIECTQEARSCDMDMDKACDVAYNPPQLLSGSVSGQSSTLGVSAGMKLFLCSSFGQAFLQCLDKVDNLCKISPSNYHSNLPLVKAVLARCQRK